MKAYFFSHSGRRADSTYNRGEMKIYSIPFCLILVSPRVLQSIVSTPHNCLTCLRYTSIPLICVPVCPALFPYFTSSCSTAISSAQVVSIIYYHFSPSAFSYYFIHFSVLHQKKNAIFIVVFAYNFRMFNRRRRRSKKEMKTKNNHCRDHYGIDIGIHAPYTPLYGICNIKI